MNFSFFCHLWTDLCLVKKSGMYIVPIILKKFHFIPIFFSKIIHFSSFLSIFLPFYPFFFLLSIFLPFYPFFFSFSPFSSSFPTSTNWKPSQMTWKNPPNMEQYTSLEEILQLSGTLNYVGKKSHLLNLIVTSINYFDSILLKSIKPLDKIIDSFLVQFRYLMRNHPCN